MKYEKPQVEIIRFNEHDLFMCSSGNLNCDNYSGRTCHSHNIVGAGICNGYTGAHCDSFTSSISGNTCFDYNSYYNGEGYCNQYLDNYNFPLSCSYFICSSFGG